MGESGETTATAASPDNKRMTSVELGAGAVLAERYRLVRLVGRGGMGSVWEAEHVTLGTPMAIKLINRRLASDEHARARFLREARAAARLRSPNVVQIFDYGVESDTPYIAMELLEGESLAARLRSGGRMSPETLLSLMTDIVSAVTKAHADGVVHRDLKPDNVFIVEIQSVSSNPAMGSEREVAKVLDFGIAKALSPQPGADSMTQTGAVLGTPVYMSPEQLVKAGLVDARSDLWSIAVIAYECIVGSRPFTAENVAELAVNLWTTEPPVPSRHAPDLPPAFDSWFAKATRRDPEDRFQSAPEMLVSLARALGKGPGGGLEPPTPTDRRPSIALVIGAAWVAVTLIGIGAFWVTSRNDDIVRPFVPERQPLPPHRANPAATRRSGTDPGPVADSNPKPVGQVHGGETESSTNSSDTVLADPEAESPPRARPAKTHGAKLEGAESPPKKQFDRKELEF